LTEIEQGGVVKMGNNKTNASFDKNTKNWSTIDALGAINIDSLKTWNISKYPKNI